MMARILAFITFTFWGLTAALAQDPIGPRLSVELNAADPAHGGCKLSFLVLNGHQADVSRAVFEAVLFDTQGRVDRLTLFDFGALPAGRPRVRQFVVPDLSCTDLGQVLFNGVESCEAGALGAAACMDGLELKSRVTVEVIG